jgi:hypothetical protein
MEAPTGKSTDPILQEQMPGPVGGEFTDTDFALLDGLAVVDDARLSTDTGFGPALSVEFAATIAEGASQSIGFA